MIQPQDNEFMYHLAEISVHKLTQKQTRTEPTLRRQLLIKNVLLLSSNILLENQSIQEEESWLDSCFHDLDADMEENDDTTTDNTENKEQQNPSDNVLVMAFPFDYVPANTKNHQQDNQSIGKGSLFFM